MGWSPSRATTSGGSTGSQGGRAADEKRCRGRRRIRCRPAALLPDELYTAAGASIGDAWAADIVVKVAPPTPEEVRRLHRGQTLIGFLAPRNPDNQVEALRAAGFRPSRWRQSRGSRGRSRWTRCPPKPTSPDTRRCCWPHGSRPGSFRC
ncbi:alanine dehydrogenase/PNT, N-terminal domain protein [Mycobacterium xenopi 3993]|nr:alanine dehydrogenase/PNT, N-terminal domain protein [Mycobacterium xenopi 3993]